MGKNKSSSSNKTTTTNTSGQNAIDGDNLGTAISGVNNSTVMVTATDHGAVAGALEMAEHGFDVVGEAVGDTLDFADSAMNNSLDFAANAFDTSVSAVGEVSTKAIDAVSEANQDSLDFADKTNARSMNFAADALDEFSAANSENLQMMAGMQGNQAAQNASQLNAIMELAKFKEDGGASENFQFGMKTIVAVTIVAGVVLFVAVRK
ncbi:chemotaxis protein [Vibrio nigripulchritudo]|uniref:chemotaxis protein n=1 Tax=Vibrio nigripulchritudo TaxID=28173 RepID=UPI0024913278|nr:chemotaxis protein [Vibrio nigripulchritudo]BDU42896.1 hypothetical protein TUMSATVNIG3_16940 [Vibrio nigripulchritudo]